MPDLRQQRMAKSPQPTTHPPAATKPVDATIPVIDYEGSGYRTDFWQGQGRDYEDAAERMALTRLVPATGGRIAEIGAGFGRLADLYTGYDQIVLFDYSRTLLADAVAQWGHDPRFVFVAGNIYHLPMAPGVLDTLVMVRVMHHLSDVDAALAQLARALHRRSTAVMEYANKRNLKAILRWLTRRQDWSPFEASPLEFVDLNFDFHPGWMDQRFAAAGLHKQQQLAVSHFRLGALKARIPAQGLARLDSSIFRLGGAYPVAPSVFVQMNAPAGVDRQQAPPQAGNPVAGLFRCVACGQAPLTQAQTDRVVCPACGTRYSRRNGIWDFKEYEEAAAP